jgi:uncharacterized membrane protein
MKPLATVTAGWSLFILENLILSENRTEIIEKIGDNKYHLLYNTLSTLSLLTITVGLLKTRKISNPRVPYKRSMAFATRTIGFIGLSQLLPSLQSPAVIMGGGKCPIDFSNKNNCMGIITRHPMLFSLAFTGLSFGMGGGLARLVGLGVFPMVFAVFGGAHQDSRYATTTIGIIE